jgi:hypothetical protein
MANAAKTTHGIRRESLHGIGDLISDISGSVPRIVGFLIPFQGHYYDLTTGPLELTDEEAAMHNAARSRVQIHELDHACAIGHGTRLYLPSHSLLTWTGERVEGELTRDIDTVTLQRNGRSFVGHLPEGKLSTVMVRTA